MKNTRAYKVIFDKNGVPTIPESVYYSLLSRGLSEAQIQTSLDVISREMVKKGLKCTETVNQL